MTSSNLLSLKSSDIKLPSRNIKQIRNNSAMEQLRLQTLRTLQGTPLENPPRSDENLSNYSASGHSSAIEIPSPRNLSASKHQTILYFDEPPSYEHPPSYEEAKLILKYYKLPTTHLSKQKLKSKKFLQRFDNCFGI